MKKSGGPVRSSRHNRLFRLLTTEFHYGLQAYDLFDEFLRQDVYNKNFCLKLLGIARQKKGIGWDIRRLAVLMLEHHVLKIAPNNLNDFDLLFTQLNLKVAPGRNQPIASAVLKEGYTKTDLRHFIPEFRNRLLRLNHVHEKISGMRSSDAALRDFIELARSDCKLSLARYLFTPEEVVDLILSELKVSDGLKNIDLNQPAFVDEELKRGLSRLPAFEAAILGRLCENGNIYWASETTSAEINSLVEYPLTTVVVVIKPPGSDIEFEIKRAGLKRTPLNVVYARKGYRVPPSHRLDGASMYSALRFEAKAASKFSYIYRCVHRTEPPIPTYISRSAIHSVPARSASVHTVSYFTEPDLFGEGFREMRAAMRESVEAFIADGFAYIPVPPGDLGLTFQFISHVAPAQAILSGTTSFRLDKLAAYLTNDGPRQYFGDGARIANPKHADKRLADALLEEILGSYRPPPVRYRTYAHYLSAAFAVAENRARADEIYLSLMKQIAKFWGTLLAVRGYTIGESFVARNVGLKSFWKAGQWQVKIIFMDHDNLVLPDSDYINFWARNVLPEMKHDERYIWGGDAPEEFAASEVGYLGSIYKVSDALARKGQSVAHQALRNAYKKTQRSLLANPRLRALFNEQFLRRLRDWDTFVSGYLHLNGERTVSARWKKEMKKLLAAKGYRPETFDLYEKAVQENRQFLERHRRLFALETKRGT